jgi:thymidylate synthase (FAD)
MSFVRLVDHMGSDESIVQAARVSYGAGTKSVNDDRALIRYLMRHKHTTPFEMVEFKFHIRAPIYVARQWLRHRTASVNEMSARYSVIPDEFFLPDELRKQSTSRGQGGEEPFGATGGNLLQKQKASCDFAFYVYDELLEKGVSRELARAHLPQCTFTEFYWKIDLHNLLHFLQLRMEDHAQKEIRDVAAKLYELVRPIVPVTCEAFEDFRIGSVTLSRLEVEAIKNRASDIPGKGENSEYHEKLKLLGLDTTNGVAEQRLVAEPLGQGTPSARVPGDEGNTGDGQTHFEEPRPFEGVCSGSAMALE